MGRGGARYLLVLMVQDITVTANSQRVHATTKVSAKPVHLHWPISRNLVDLKVTQLPEGSLDRNN
jgi:hypothetical protein